MVAAASCPHVAPGARRFLLSAFFHALVVDEAARVLSDDAVGSCARMLAPACRCLLGERAVDDTKSAAPSAYRVYLPGAAPRNLLGGGMVVGRTGWRTVAADLLPSAPDVAEADYADGLPIGLVAM